MARVATAIANWNKGEWSSKMQGRIDIPAYGAACRKMLNALPLVQGGWIGRAGTRYVAGSKSNGTPSFLPFEFSQNQGFVIEAGDQYFRFFYNPTRAQSFVPTTTAAFTNGDFASGITGWTDSSTGSASISYDSTNHRMSLTPASGGIAKARQTVTVPAAQQHSFRFQVFGNPVKVRVGTSAGGTQLLGDVACGPGWHTVSFTSTGTSAYVEFNNDADDAAVVGQIDSLAFLSNTAFEVITPFAGADAENIRWAQSADLLYLVCAGGYAPMVLKRHSNVSWSLEYFDYQNGPYYGENTDQALTLTPSTYTGSVTVTASKPLFKSTDVGRHLRLSEKEDNGFRSGWGVITAYSNSKSVTMLFKGDLESDEAHATYKWRLGAWGGIEGYPAVIAFYEDRLCFANTDARPQSIWCSSTGAYNDFSPAGVITSNDGSLLDDVQPQNALFFTLQNGEINPILWMISGQTLLVGTAAGEFSVSASTLNEALTPDNVKAAGQSSRGGSAVPALRIDNRAVFVDATGRKIYEMVFDGVSSVYQAGDLTLYAEHMLAGNATRLAYQKAPRPTIWACCDDGTLRSCAYQPDQQVLGWARHTIGGTAPKVLSLAALAGDRQTTVWALVERTIDGGTQRYIEYFDDEFDPDMGDALADFLGLDCSVEYDGSPADTFSGLDHIEGESVMVLGDGKVFGPYTVASGAITLEAEVSQAQIGLPFSVEVEKLPNILGSQNGPAIGKRQTASTTFIQFVNTVGGQYGRTTSDGELFEEIAPRTGGDPLDDPAALYNGLRKVDWPTGYDGELTFEVRQRLPLPIGVTGIFPTQIVADS